MSCVCREEERRSFHIIICGSEFVTRHSSESQKLIFWGAFPKSKQVPSLPIEFTMELTTVVNKKFIH